VIKLPNSSPAVFQANLIMMHTPDSN